MYAPLEAVDFIVPGLDGGMSPDVRIESSLAKAFPSEPTPWGTFSARKLMRLDALETRLARACLSP